MSVKDRTAEFYAAVESIRSRSSFVQGGFQTRNNLEHRRPLLGNNSNGGKSVHGSNGMNRTEFSRMAGAIGKDINSTAMKLQKLTKLAKRKTLFDDRPVEISELTYIIKQDIAKLNKQIALLQQYVRDHKKNNRQADEHSSNVVVMLQSKLASTSMSFKDVLEIRTQNMKDSKDRREQFMFSSNQQANVPAADSPLYNTQRDNEKRNTDFLALDMSSGQAQQQQLQFIEQQDNYIESRVTAIESIESTIAELGNIFQQLAQMIAEQRETVQRIDANTDDIQTNVEGAQKELLKYYASISSNRWLMIKIFSVIIFFFLVFILNPAFKHASLTAMGIKYVLLVSRQGKVRLAKWFNTLSPKEKQKIVKEVTQMVLSRRTKMCNFLEYKDEKVVYRRYASLFFVTGISSTDNELITLEIIHRYVEILDRYFGNVCELDLIFNFQKAYFVLDELIIAGEMQESSKKSVLRVISQQDALEEGENGEKGWPEK
ncbi:11954_t:CDS:10 [Acaulospora morrowiae]|uniref:AP-1 complex subunit sigma-1 n=2 Tax=Acaulospora TaxID=27372 RepID=A0A9N8WAF6_9GLOM|nr:11954_t:CDS:10 [Acaulospora morrowiae]